MEYLILVMLVVCSGMFSGLTIGLSSLSKDELEMLASRNNQKAKKVLEVVQDYNLLLVTLLFGNTIVNVLLTSYMGSVIGTGAFTVMLSTFLILIFGEITPGAALTKHALSVGAMVAPLVKILIVLFYPISKPIAYVLNKLLGQSLPTIYTRADLTYLLDKHQFSNKSDIDEQDGRIMKGVLLLNQTIASKEITKVNFVYKLEYNQKITLEILKTIKDKGYTRIPVVKDKTVIGIINVKSLIGIKCDDVKAIDLMKSDKFLTFNALDKLDTILEKMINTKIHFSVITHKNKWAGILTMEDILEVMFQQEIYDETDNIKKED